ncbi:MULTISPECIES: S9 family peptidase [Microbacterium]|uniref:alpha/beta hydrolase family protein n=1 Tax=Microbacterium TaxID=33882 RepID=UPI0027837454|nr:MULTISPECIES: alpha/beta fold hydrolase [Microbacterium]MDQ1085174.1 pimeloyl-ACP methyl ester carboxylesterase [Microbacterium sp. SORGH_AS_0344]MDQ1169520.1 pimeloyl-ACP methyl ester carboxylesterase [Microbacterium proteolyticum]
MIRSLAVGAGIATATVALAHTALAGYVARRLVAPRSAKVFAPVTIEGDTVSVPVIDDSREPGTYGLRLDDGSHVMVGDVVRDDGDRVVRRILARPEGLDDGDVVAAWTSQNIGAPEDVGPTRHVAVPLRRGGVAEAWEIGDPDAADGRWTIHVHGLRSSRNGALRSAPATTDAGWMSLVVSYAGDDECAPADALPSSLGTREWRDVDDAIAYAIGQGAREIVLVAWSMGGTIAMLALEESPHRGTVTGLILVAPALDWTRIVENAVAGAHLPRSVAAASMGVLRSRIGARALGLIEAVDARALTWVGTARPGPRVPTLILHGRTDPVVPFSGSVAYVERHPDAELVAFDATGHCNEANQDPSRFRDAIVAFLGKLPRG